jgi:DNA-damage-inducible protein J
LGKQEKIDMTAVPHCMRKIDNVRTQCILLRMTMLNVRIEDSVKERAGRTLSTLGLDTSSAVKLFLNQVIIEEGLPFIPTNNRAVIRARWDGEIARASKGRSFKTARAARRGL